MMTSANWNRWGKIMGVSRVSKLVRLYGKKRGSRMSGWWVMGSVGEAAFFATLFLLGIVSLSIVGSRQLLSPETQIIRVGFGFWLMIIASSSFVVIGLSGLILRVAQTVASPELRSALAQQAEREHQRRSRGPTAQIELPNTPSLQAFTESPGERLAYRLAGQRGEIGPLVLSFLFAASWNGLLAVLAVIAIGNIARGTPSWFLIALLVPFGVVGSWRHGGSFPSSDALVDWDRPLQKSVIFRCCQASPFRYIFVSTAESPFAV